MGIVKEFREFALKGNVLDLAVGVIIGGAFGGIVNSLIKDIIMPVIAIPGNVDFTNKYIGLTPTVREALEANPNMTLDAARAIGPTMAYGSFVTIVINFLILAFCVFMMVKWVASIMPKEAPAPPPGPSEKDYLKEIRDALVKGKAAGV